MAPKKNKRRRRFTRITLALLLAGRRAAPRGRAAKARQRRSILRRRRLWSVFEVARRYRVAPRTVHRWKVAGLLPAPNLPRSVVAFRPADVKRFLLPAKI